MSANAGVFYEFLDSLKDACLFLAPAFYRPICCTHCLINTVTQFLENRKQCLWFYNQQNSSTAHPCKRYRSIAAVKKKKKGRDSVSWLLKTNSLCNVCCLCEQVNRNFIETDEVNRSRGRGFFHYSHLHQEFPLGKSH